MFIVHIQICKSCWILLLYLAITQETVHSIALDTTVALQVIAIYHVCCMARLVVELKL